MTAPRAFTTLLTEALRKLGPASARANQWAERLAIPRGYSRQEYESFLAPILKEEMEKGNRAMTANELAGQLDQRGAVSRFQPIDSKAYASGQRITNEPGEDNYRVKLARVERLSDDSTPDYVQQGPHGFDGVSKRHVLPSWAKMEDVMTERGVREPMAHQLQSDQAVHNSNLRPLAKILAERNGGAINDNISAAVDLARRESGLAANAYNRGARVLKGRRTALQSILDEEFGHGNYSANSFVGNEASLPGELSPRLTKAVEALRRTRERFNAVDGRQNMRIRAKNLGLPANVLGSVEEAQWHYIPSPWDAANGDANYRPAIALAIRDAIDAGHDRLLFPSVETLQTTAFMNRGHAKTNVDIVRGETARMLRAIDVEPEWEPATAIGKRDPYDGRGPDPEDFDLPESERYADMPMQTTALRLDKLKGKALPILSAAILAGAGASSLGAQETENPDPPARREGETDAQYRQRVEDARVLDETLRLVADEEGFREMAYQDPTGTWTVGFGRTGEGVGPGTRMTRDEALAWTRAYLERDLARMRQNGVRPTPQTLSFAYNAGYGRFQRTGAEAAAKAGDWDRVAELMSGVTTSKGVELPGLVARRQREVEDLREYIASVEGGDSTDAEARLREAIRLAAQVAPESTETTQAGLLPPEDDGTSWGRVAGIAAAIGAAALGGPALARRLRGAMGTPTVPIQPPIPAQGLRDQLTTMAPPTHPATAEELQAMAAHRADRATAINRLRSLALPLEPTSEIPRQVDDILQNGPSYARQMRPVDQDIADIQESLVQHNLVRGSGRVPDEEWVRIANEFKARAGGKEFWLDNPDEVLADPRLTATAIAAQENGAAMTHAIRRSLDPTLPPEVQQFAARMADEYMTRMIGAQQRLTRDASELGRSLRSLRLLGGLFEANGNNGAAWMAAAEKLAGKELNKADASAIAHLVATGNYLQAAKKLNQLRKAPLLDKVDEFLRSSMQLTLLRPFRDLLSNTTNVADHAIAGRIGSIADLGLSVLSGTRESISPSIVRQGQVIAQGFGTGGMDALRLLARRETPDDIEFMRRVAERMDFTNETTFTHPVTNALATQARRWFTAADYPSYRAAVNDALANYAMVAAYKAGHRGPALAKAAMDIFEHPGPALTIKAQAEAVERVWQNKTPLSTATHRWMSDTTPGKRFMVRRVMPFVHTTSAMVGQAMDQSPVGYVKTAADLTRFVVDALKGNPSGELQRSVARRIGMHATGAGWMYLGWVLSQNGDLQGTYDGTDARDAAADEEQNIRPMTIRVGGKWYAISMLLGPQAMLMAMGAGLRTGLERLAQQEVEDPTMERRWTEAMATVGAPVAKETFGVLGDLPLADAVGNVGRLAGDVSRGELSAGTGNLAGRIVTQAVPAVVQQTAELMDRDADGNVVRRDTRAGSFGEAMRASILEALPGRRDELPIRVKPFGGQGTGIAASDNPLASLADPFRTRYAANDDPVTRALVDYDAFPTPVRRRENEMPSQFADRRRVEGAEEKAALRRALEGYEEGGLNYASQRLRDAWYATGEAIPSPEYTAVLRDVVRGLRASRREP